MPINSRRQFILQSISVAVATVLVPGLAKAAEKISVTKAYSDASAGRSLLIDIRRPSEWKKTGVGKHAFAMSIEQHPNGPQGFLTELIKLTSGNRSARVDLFCARGGRSKSLQRRLLKLGYTNVNDVTEGMVGGWGKKGWIKTGLPTLNCSAVQSCKKAAGL
jgi:rhodanese-related sulfurtransferase